MLTTDWCAINAEDEYAFRLRRVMVVVEPGEEFCVPTISCLGWIILNR